MYGGEGGIHYATNISIFHILTVLSDTYHLLYYQTKLHDMFDFERLCLYLLKLYFLNNCTEMTLQSGVSSSHYDYVNSSQEML